MTASTTPIKESEYLPWEVNPQFTREEIIVASGQNLPAGAVVGVITASGKYAAYDNAASDGTETAAGVLLSAVDASAGDADGVAIVRGPAIVRVNALDWNGQDSAAVTSGMNDLAALNIISR